MKKSPILILSWHPGSSNIQTAGGFKRLYYILANPSHKVVVIDKYPSIYKDLENNQVKIIEYGKTINLNFLENIFPLLYKVIDRFISFMLIIFHVFLLKIKFGVIYISFSELPHLTFAGVLLKYLYSVPLVLCNLNVNTIFFDRFVNKLLHRKADRVLTISRDLQKNLEKAGITAPYINTVGFDMDPFNLDKGSAKKYDAIFVGRHIEEKGIFDLIQIWGILKKKYMQSLKLITIGDVPAYLKDKIHDAIKKNNVTKEISLLGNVSDEEKIKCYHASRLCVFPSHHEGWGITPIEALASGIPVVLYDLEVYKESLEGCKGVFRVQEHDIFSFAEKVLSVLADKSNYAKINYQAIVKNDWKTIAKQEYKLILSI